MEEQNVETLLNRLREDLQGNESTPIIVAEDRKLNNAVASQKREQDKEYNKRNNLYTELLRYYIHVYNKKEKAKAIYKCIFFSVTMSLFCSIVIFCLKNIINLSVQGDGNLANVGIAISNVAGIISTLIVLPKIIAEHLFPIDEERNMIGMVKNMQDNDANIRNLLFNSHGKNGENEEKDNLLPSHLNSDHND